MSWSTSKALTDPAIRKPMAFPSEFRVQLKEIPVEITLRLCNRVHSSTVIVRQSHIISVPGLDAQAQAGAISQFVCAYNAATAKGMKPEASWLKQNPEFR